MRILHVPLTCAVSEASEVHVQVREHASQMGVSIDVLAQTCHPASC